MKAETFEIVKLVLQIVLIVLTTYIIPKVDKWLKQNTTENQRKEFLFWTQMGIKFAEIIYQEKGQGKLKQEFVLEWLRKNGIKVTDEQAKIVIDSIVDYFNAQGWDNTIEV